VERCLRATRNRPVCDAFKKLARLKSLIWYLFSTTLPPGAAPPVSQYKGLLDGQGRVFHDGELMDHRVNPAYREPPKDSPGIDLVGKPSGIRPWIPKFVSRPLTSAAPREPLVRPGDLRDVLYLTGFSQWSRIKTRISKPWSRSPTGVSPNPPVTNVRSGDLRDWRPVLSRFSRTTRSRHHTLLLKLQVQRENRPSTVAHNIFERFPWFGGKT